MYMLNQLAVPWWVKSFMARMKAYPDFCTGGWRRVAEMLGMYRQALHGRSPDLNSDDEFLSPLAEDFEEFLRVKMTLKSNAIHKLVGSGYPVSPEFAQELSCANKAGFTLLIFCLLHPPASLLKHSKPVFVVPCASTGRRRRGAVQVLRDEIIGLVVVGPRAAH